MTVAYVPYDPAALRREKVPVDDESDQGVLRRPRSPTTRHPSVRACSRSSSWSRRTPTTPQKAAIRTKAEGVLAEARGGRPSSPRSRKQALRRLLSTEDGAAISASSSAGKLEAPLDDAAFALDAGPGERRSSRAPRGLHIIKVEEKHAGRHRSRSPTCARRSCATLRERGADDAARERAQRRPREGARAARALDELADGPRAQGARPRRRSRAASRSPASSAPELVDDRVRRSSPARSMRSSDVEPPYYPLQGDREDGERDPAARRGARRHRRDPARRQGEGGGARRRRGDPRAARKTGGVAGARRRARRPRATPSTRPGPFGAHRGDPEARRRARSRTSSSRSRRRRRSRQASTSLRTPRS